MEPMDRPRTLPGTPASRALLGGARVLVKLAVALAAVSALLVVLTWLGVRNLERHRFAAATARPSPGTTPDPWSVRDFDYPSRGVRIAARLSLPVGEGPHPALVIAHGSGESRRSQYEYLAAQLVSRGFAFLTYDKRGVGDSGGTYSSIGPETSDAMFDLLSDDVIAGVEYLTRCDDIDAKRIGLIGISQGGWIAPLAAAKSRSVAFLVIVSGPAVSVGEEIYYSELSGEREGGSAFASDGELTSMLTAFQGPHGFDPVPVLERLEVPGLWILGDGDRSIPIPETVARLESLIARGKPFTLRVLPGIGHGMRHLDTGEPAPMASIAIDWLADIGAP